MDVIDCWVLIWCRVVNWVRRPSLLGAIKYFHLVFLSSMHFKKIIVFILPFVAIFISFALVLTVRFTQRFFIALCAFRFVRLLNFIVSCLCATSNDLSCRASYPICAFFIFCHLNFCDVCCQINSYSILGSNPLKFIELGSILKVFATHFILLGLIIFVI